MPIVYIKSDSDEKVDLILEKIKELQLNVEVVTGNGDPLDETMFFAARASAKLDNLGQLTHLFKISRTLQNLERSSDVLATAEIARQKANREELEVLYDDYVERYKFDPQCRDQLGTMTQGQLYAKFKNYSAIDIIPKLA